MPAYSSVGNNSKIGSSDWSNTSGVTHMQKVDKSKHARTHYIEDENSSNDVRCYDVNPFAPKAINHSINAGPKSFVGGDGGLYSNPHVGGDGGLYVGGDGGLYVGGDGGLYSESFIGGDGGLYSESHIGGDGGLYVGGDGGLYSESFIGGDGGLY